MGGDVMKHKVKFYFLYAFILVFAMSFLSKSIYTIKDVVSTKRYLPLLKEYKILRDRYEFSLPMGWTLREQSFPGGEIIYHGDITSPNRKIWGIVQVWNTDITLKDFIEKTKYSPADSSDIKDFKILEGNIGKYPGYKLSYIRRGNDDKLYHAMEYFIKGKNKEFFRISFFTEQKYYNKALLDSIDNLLNTIKIK